MLAVMCFAFSRVVRTSFVCVAFAAGALDGRAAEPAPAGLRELTTDRPDTTESPFTVNPGHVQLEMDAVSYTRDREGGAKTEEWEAAAFNLRFGLTRDFEAGIFVVPFRRMVETPPAGTRHRAS